MTERKPKRRWYQFSLWTLLVVVLVLCSSLGWLSRKINQAREHQEIVNAIVKADGFVKYEYNLLGLGPVVRVVGWRNFGDAELEKLKGVTSIKELDVDGCQGVTDTGMKHLQGLKNLEWLNISHTKVTEAGLEPLKDMTNLKELWICCLYQANRKKKVSDKDIKELQDALPNCSILGP